MSTRRLTLAAAGVYVVAGPLLAVGLWTSAGPLATSAAVLLWVGAGGLLAALLLAAREQQRAVRRLQRTLDPTAEVIRASTPGVTRTELTAALTALGDELRAGQEATTSQVAQQLDSRVLGLHAVVRELAGHDRAPGAAPLAASDAPGAAPLDQEGRG